MRTYYDDSATKFLQKSFSVRVGGFGRHIPRTTSFVSFPPFIMTTVQRLFSLSLLGVMLFAIAPRASAQEVTISDAEVDAVLTDAETEANSLAADHPCADKEGLRRVLCVARHAYRRLVEHHCNEAEEPRVCARRVRQQIRQRVRHWIQNHCTDSETDARICNHRPRRDGDRPNRRNIPEEARDALRACRDNNDDQEARKQCAMSVLEQHGIEKSDFRRGHNRQRFRRLPDEVRTELRACRDAETRTDMRACIQSVLDSHNDEQ